MRTFNKKDVFCIANAEDAIQYINQECYFEDSFNGLQYCIDNNITGLLTCVRDDDDDNPVDCIFVSDRDIKVMDSRHIMSFGLCLPCELVKKEEPKYRAFKSIEEFISVVGEIGSVIRYKQINYNAKYGVMFFGVIEDEFGKINVLIGGIPRDFSELFEGYVLLKDGKEVPFGIKVDYENC